MKISLGMPIPDLGSLPGSRPGGGVIGLLGFQTSTTEQTTEANACSQVQKIERFKRTSASTPVAVGDIIFREKAGTSYPPDGYYKDLLAGFYKVKNEGEVVEIGSCATIESFDSTDTPEANAENICVATIGEKMYKLGSADLAVTNIVYKDVDGAETADEGFYKTTIGGDPVYYEISNNDNNGEVVKIELC
tara:strand:- start:868 stop:1440 length:573 start_codon:yes stop_codon:yes gene_type:complete